MIKLVWDKAFVRKLKKIVKGNPELKDIFYTKIALLSESPFHKSLCTYKLSGKLRGYYACSLDNKYRLLFEILDSNTFLLIDIGTHDEVY